VHTRLRYLCGSAGACRSHRTVSCFSYGGCKRLPTLVACSARTPRLVEQEVRSTAPAVIRPSPNHPVISHGTLVADAMAAMLILG
jgi:hypothetical protein